MKGNAQSGKSNRTKSCTPTPARHSTKGSLACNNQQQPDIRMLGPVLLTELNSTVRSPTSIRSGRLTRAVHSHQTSNGFASLDSLLEQQRAIVFVSANQNPHSVAVNDDDRGVTNFRQLERGTGPQYCRYTARWGITDIPLMSYRFHVKPLLTRPLRR